MNNLLASFPATMHASTADLNAWHHGWDGEWGHMFFGSAMMLIFWGVIALLVVLTVRWAMKTRESETVSTGSGSALHILEQRFASGDIDKAEFLERKKLLSK